MKFSISTLLVGAMALTSSVVHAWGGRGHLVVARIAYDILQKESPVTIESVEKLLKVGQVVDPGWTSKEGKHPFVECVTYADDIKRKGGAYQQGWHFIDTPYLDQGGKISDFNFTADAHNVTEAIGSIVSWFNKNAGYNTSYIYKNITAQGLAGYTEEDF